MLDKKLEEKLAEMLSEGKNKYQVINAVARRARDINEGMTPLVPNEELDPLQTAVAELKADKLNLSLGAPPEGDKEEEQASA